MKINTIRPQDNNFTQIITSIALVPKKLYYIGILPEIRLPTIAIVGTRKPTRYGIEVTERLSYDLAKRSVVIMSGLALGVDAIAHTSALNAGGKTMAVLGNGLASVQPATNRALAERIVANSGALLSEYTPEVHARPYMFLERNRIVSGLSDAILITEASARSGTLNTARHALEQGKDVFVVPGNITSPLSAGCNLLIKQGASVVTCAEDILEIIAPQLLTSQTVLALGNNPLQVAIIQLLQSGVRDGDELQERSATTPSEFATELTMMELEGTIRSLGANQWTLK